jgi:hypothetical protein
MKYEIQNILDNQKDSLEQLGTKEKFWFDNNKKLFKIGRPGTGEDWVEVVSAEICKMLDIPHAKYEFATYENDQGTITTNFVPKDGRLIHGNEVLAKAYSNVHIEYQETMKYKLREYKLKVIKSILTLPTTLNDKPISPQMNMLKKDTEIKSAFDMFIGYIMLDCLISNQDRHHENWGIIIIDKDIFLAPTFDHASGLGNKETDAEKVDRLNSKDKGYQVKAFVRKAKTPFYHKSEKTLTTIEAFRLCSEWNSKAAKYWLDKLNKITEDNLYTIFKKVPNHIISEISIKFAIEIIKENKIRLLEIQEELQNEN